jgi:hypothetical protein
MRTYKIGFVLLAIPLAILLAACSQSLGATKPPVTSTIVGLVHQPTGTVDLRWNPSTTQLTVTIQMSGLTPSSTHPAHIYQGTCQMIGGILLSLHPVVTNAVGVGISQTVIPTVTNGVPVSGWAIAIQNGPDLTPADQVLPIACVTIHNPRFRHLFHSDLGPTIAADQNVSGQKRLTFTQHHLTITVVVHGLVPGSTHMDHIHLGTCIHQGRVLYWLQSLVADKNGTATTVLPNITHIPAQG